MFIPVIFVLLISFIHASHDLKCFVLIESFACNSFKHKSSIFPILYKKKILFNHNLLNKLFIKFD